MKAMGGGEIMGSLLGGMIPGLNSPELQAQVIELLKAIAETHASVKRIEGYLIATGQLDPLPQGAPGASGEVMSQTQPASLNGPAGPDQAPENLGHQF